MVGNLIYELLADAGEVLPLMMESDDYRLAVRYGYWTPTQTIVLLSHPYAFDHYGVLDLLSRQTVTIQPDSTFVEYHGSLWTNVESGGSAEHGEIATGFISVAEIDTFKATDALLLADLEEEVQPWVELSRYNASTTPVMLNSSSGLEDYEKAMDKYLNVTVSQNLQNDTADLIAGAVIQYYYTETNLDRTGDGDANDPQDFNESTLGLYWLNESSGDWIKLSDDMEWVFATGVNTTDVELYGESYAGYVWASLGHFSTYGVAGRPNNRPPDVSSAYPSQEYLWPPNHKFVEVTIEGVTDPDGDSVTITITSITSDEPTDTLEGAGGSNHAPDAYINGIGTDTAHLRAERSGTGNGRVYEITFVASDGKGGETEGTVTVSVPHHPKRNLYYCIDDGQIYDATEGRQQGTIGKKK